MIPLLAGLVGIHVAWTWFRAWTDGRRAAALASSAAGAGTGTLPSIAVLVPVWNDAEVVHATLVALRRAVAAAAAGGATVEVVAIAGGADGSYERTRAVFAELGLAGTVLPQDAPGKNAALNRGLAHTTADVVVFLDADTLVEPGWLRALVGPLARDQADATTGHFEALYPSPVASVFEIDQVVTQEVRADVNLFGGGTIALSRSALEAVGGALPEDVPVGVDWELSRRVAATGLRRAFVPDARVRTAVPHTWRAYLRTEVRWRRAHGAVERRLGSGPASLRWWLHRYLQAAQAGVLLGWALLPPAFGIVGGRPLHGLFVWLAFVAWILLRHAARPLTAYAHSGRTRFLRHTPAYLLAWMVSAAASVYAVLTPRNLRADFKGSRPDSSPADASPRLPHR